MMLKTNAVRTVLSAMCLFAFMPLLAAVPVNDALCFDLVYKGDINNNGKFDNAEIGNLMTIAQAAVDYLEGRECLRDGTSVSRYVIGDTFPEVESI